MNNIFIKILELGLLILKILTDTLNPAPPPPHFFIIYIINSNKKQKQQPQQQQITKK